MIPGLAFFNLEIPGLEKTSGIAIPTRKGTEVNISDDVEKAEVFCEYFSSVFTHENTEDTPDMPNITQKSVWPPIKFSEDIILQKLRN